MAWLNFKANVLQGELRVWSVPQIDVFELDLALSWPDFWRLLSSLDLLLGDFLKGEHFFSVVYHPHKPVKAAEEVHQPAHVSGPSEEQNESDRVSGRSVLGDQKDCDDVEQLGSVEHAQVIPAPATMMCNKMGGGLVEKHMLLCHDCLFLTERANHCRASHALVEIGVDGAPQRATH